MKIIRENNNIYFNDKFCDKNWGTAMGTKFAPTYATLVLGFLQEKSYLLANQIFENGFGLMLMISSYFVKPEVILRITMVI